jgi:hypothetical protein
MFLDFEEKKRKEDDEGKQNEKKLLLFQMHSFNSDQANICFTSL